MPWDGPREAFASADAIVLRSTWGYYRALNAFRAWTEAMAAATRLFNSIDLVRWNLRKDYVAKLAAAGVRVPRSFVVPCEVSAIGRVFEETGWARAVVKPASGASGHSVELLQRATLAGQVAGLADEARQAGVVVQEFLPEIADGELSLVCFDGVFSHAIRKRVASLRPRRWRGARRRADRDRGRAAGAGSGHGLCPFVGRALRRGDDEASGRNASVTSLNSAVTSTGSAATIHWASAALGGEESKRIALRGPAISRGPPSSQPSTNFPAKAGKSDSGALATGR